VDIRFLCFGANIRHLLMSRNKFQLDGFIVDMVTNIVVFDVNVFDFPMKDIVAS